MGATLKSTSSPLVSCVFAALQSTLQRVGNRSNIADMACQPFYKWIQETYTWHVVGLFAALYALGGFPAMVWGGALRIAWVYHITWFVNSASHCWGYQSYNTGMALRVSCTGLSRSPATPCMSCVAASLKYTQSLSALLFRLAASMYYPVLCCQDLKQCLCHCR